MARHRNVRSMDYSDDYDGYNDVYGHSVDDDSCISPSDASQWIYDRAQGQRSMSEFMAHHRDIQEEDEDDGTIGDCNKRKDSDTFQLPVLNDTDTARLMSCIDEIRNVVGEMISEKQIVEAIMENDFDFPKALNVILDSTHKTSEAIPSGSTAKAQPSSIIEKGVGPRLMEKFLKQPVPITTITITPIADRTNIKRGFEVNSPVLQSPAVSGRNTPEISDEIRPVCQRREPVRNAIELFAKERQNEKKNINMIVIGHVDAGKSTLMGHLLFNTGNVPQRVMHKHEQESKKLGKQSFMYAWVLDETGEERERGITMDVGRSKFETKTKSVTLLDAPGHKDFIPNMISGATQADVALLVVDATTGEFETGFEQGGQTREHALLVRSLGVNQLGVVVNKLDTSNWSKERFDDISVKLRTFLKQAGFKECDVVFVPCSGLTGENLVTLSGDSALTKWYSGPTLLDVIENFKTPERSLDKPFRMSVSDIYKGTGPGYCITGRIETGMLCVNDKIQICPSRETGQIKSLYIDDVPENTAFAGDQVSVTLAGVDVSNVSVGFMLSDSTSPVPITNKIRARIVVFNLRVPITIGFPVLIHHQSLIEPASITKLKAQLHKSTGEVLKKNPRCLGNNSCALIELETTRPICVERFADCKELGRIMLRVGGITIAAGLITDILKKM